MNRPAPNGNAGRVLIVEDDEGLRDMLKYNLTTAGFLVHERRWRAGPALPPDPLLDAAG